MASGYIAVPPEELSEGERAVAAALAPASAPALAGAGSPDAGAAAGWWHEALTDSRKGAIFSTTLKDAAALVSEVPC